jgi:hypothetical protein
MWPSGCAQSTELAKDARLEMALPCAAPSESASAAASAAATPGLLRLSYRLTQGVENEGWIVQVSLLPHPARALAKGDRALDASLNAHALGTIASYAPPKPGAIAHAVFGLPAWYCAPDHPDATLVLRLLPANPAGTLTSTRLELTGWTVAHPDEAARPPPAR